MSTTTTTHETFIHGVRDLVLAHADLKPEQVEKLANAKLVYGIGNGSYRGVTYYSAWTHKDVQVDVVEIAATAEESWVQLAGTTIHELAHVLGGHGAGHGPEWKDLAVDLGFAKRPLAAGQRYCLAMVKPALRVAIARLAASLADGSPAFGLHAAGLGLGFKVGVVRPCSAGRGVKGGRSMGKGSGRLRLWECDCAKPVKVRVASDDFQAHCDRCDGRFHRA
jgi:hypothetical protein